MTTDAVVFTIGTTELIVLGAAVIDRSPTERRKTRSHPSGANAQRAIEALRRRLTEGDAVEFVGAGFLFKPYEGLGDYRLSAVMDRARVLTRNQAVPACRSRASERPFGGTGIACDATFTTSKKARRP